MSAAQHPAGGQARGSFTIEPRGGYSLAASIRFLEGFEPAAFPSAPEGAPVVLDAAFPLEGSWLTVGVSVEQAESGAVRGRLYADRALGRAELSAAKAQVERILSLDVDGSGYAEVGERDPVIGRLQAAFPGLRPVCFWSWYEAAAWSIIGQRMRMGQAAAVKAGLATELGTPVQVGGSVQQAFPAPRQLAELQYFPGLTAAKVERLRALAEAARVNRFDSAGLRSMPRADALAALQELPGIGPLSAELVLLRGAGDPDHVPDHTARLTAAVQWAYDLDSPPTAEHIATLAKAWAPYRTWAVVLLRSAHYEATRG